MKTPTIAGAGGSAIYSSVLFVLSVTSTLLAAHAAAATENVGKTSQPIILGDVVPQARQHDLGLVTVGGGCSGTLLNQYWVLTADHCVAQPGTDGKSHPGLPDQPYAATTITATWSNQVITPTRYVRYWNSDGVDVALIFLGNGDFGPVGLRLIAPYAVDTTITLEKFGQGICAFATGSGPSAVPATSNCGYRSAYFNPSTVSDNGVVLPINASGQVGDGGDSGGADFIVGPGGVLSSIASVQSTCSPTGYVPGKPQTWQWATGVSYCTSAPLYKIRDSIVAHVRDEKPFDRVAAEVRRSSAAPQLHPFDPVTDAVTRPNSKEQFHPFNPVAAEVTKPGGPVLGEPGGFAGPAPAMTGTFDTDFGVLMLGATGGTYSVSNGSMSVEHIYGNFMDGTWRQSTAAQKCADGTFHGRVHFQFNTNGFIGSYGYCDGPPTAGRWNGTRRK